MKTKGLWFKCNQSNDGYMRSLLGVVTHVGKESGMLIPDYTPQRKTTNAELENEVSAPAHCQLPNSLPTQTCQATPGISNAFQVAGATLKCFARGVAHRHFG